MPYGWSSSWKLFLLILKEPEVCIHNQERAFLDFVCIDANLQRIRPCCNSISAPFPWIGVEDAWGYGEDFMFIWKESCDLNVATACIWSPWFLWRDGTDNCAQSRVVTVAHPILVLQPGAAFLLWQGIAAHAHMDAACEQAPFFHPVQCHVSCSRSTSPKTTLWGFIASSWRAVGAAFPCTSFRS